MPPSVPDSGILRRPRDVAPVGRESECPTCTCTAEAAPTHLRAAVATSASLWRRLSARVAAEAQADADRRRPNAARVLRDAAYRFWRGRDYRKSCRPRRVRPPLSGRMWSRKLRPATKIPDTGSRVYAAPAQPYILQRWVPRPQGMPNFITTTSNNFPQGLKTFFGPLRDMEKKLFSR